MTAEIVEQLPEGREWIYEVKFDGYRALLVKNGTAVRIHSRNDKDLTAAYPHVRAAAAALRAQTAVVDGEIVAVDANGHPAFQALQHPSAHPHHTVVFYAFDLLLLNGKNLVAAPLVERRERLAELLADPPPHVPL